eukprot:10062856-Lingulodinium_polyedra.AAC.1
MCAFVRIAIPSRPSVASRQAVVHESDVEADGLDPAREVLPVRILAGGSRSVVDGEDVEPVVIPPSKKVKSEPPPHPRMG